MIFAKINPSPVQVEEMKRAFFAGAWAILCASRANRYRESINALVEIWGEPENEDDVKYEPSALDDFLVGAMREIRRKCPTCGEEKMKIGGECEGCGTIHSS